MCIVYDERFASGSKRQGGTAPGEDITLDHVVKTAKLVQPVPSVRVAITPVKEVSSNMKSAAAMSVAGRSKEIQVPTFKRMSSRSDYTVLLAVE